MAGCRPIADIDAEIGRTADRLTALYAERAAAVAARIEAVCAAFDDGASPKEIGERFGLSEVAARAMLWRNGRSTKGRARLRQQMRLHAIVERHGAPQP